MLLGVLSKGVSTFDYFLKNCFKMSQKTACIFLPKNSKTG